MNWSEEKRKHRIYSNYKTLFFGSTFFDKLFFFFGKIIFPIINTFKTHIKLFIGFDNKIVWPKCLTKWLIISDVMLRVIWRTKTTETKVSNPLISNGLQVFTRLPPFAPPFTFVSLLSVFSGRTGYTDVTLKWNGNDVIFLMFGSYLMPDFWAAP